ncbi:Exodeoxyribonuclease VII large subunit [Draconibacterium orientale]|uniref:Exodeoxyribonuclease 7 large subunit n=1 Tax=Draconibacterium orientale TaxID=1168034 RepID=X5DXE5_9BACT|nr:exodeoxyribonuclease VII large subunit [Draconibacterium orientale]AHW58941.1 exodeoxyribonuclease VII large subunit [Draconibacterium orientale]SET51086.1 Exodeoxyribonuclease VII large subunit [Draconibacterium orientale]
MNQKFTLSELNQKIKDALLDAFPGTVWVVAEVSELKHNRSGHCYLELVEKEGNTITARSRATIWSYTYRMLKPYFETSTGQLFSEGIKVLVQATVEYHSAYGLSLNIKDIDPTYTVGDMAMQRKEIINRLKAEGVFDMNKELSLPLVPQKIAVISSATAAGYQDFMNQLENNEYGFKFYTKLFEAYMQGAETVPSIIHALERIFAHDDFFDAVAIIRGGGATADLSSFDDYDLAMNITQFPLPVITGIGHEKDDTIIDLVAHTRMKTPTAVAEFFVSGVERYYERLLELENGIVQLTRETLEFQQDKLERIAEGLKYSVADFINDRQRQLSKRGNELQQNVSRFSFKKQNELTELRHSLDSGLSVWFVEAKNNMGKTQRMLRRLVGEAVFKADAKLNHQQDLLAGRVQNLLAKERDRILINENSVRLLNPENVLKRGFTLTLKDGKIIKSSNDVAVGEQLETRFADGTVESKIIKKK